VATYRIVSCDGGGIRGLLTALVIRRLHEELRILDRVNLYAGTSTGGIIALGLAGGRTIEQIVSLYQERAKDIFIRPEGIGTKVGLALKEGTRAALKRIPGVSKELLEALDTYFSYQDELWYPKYTGEGLRRLVSELFPEDPTLGTLGGAARVLVTTFQLRNEKEGSWVPRTLHSLDTPGNDLQMSHVVEAAMCTSAAPTFFPPHKHGKLGFCVDGGLFANNPASVALAAALELKIPIESIRLLSIGTGGTKNSMTIPHSNLFHRGAENYGILGWLYPRSEGQTPSYLLMNALMEAGSATSHLVALQVLGNGQYQRVQVPLKKSIGLDDVGAIGDLQTAAKELFQSDAWGAIRGWVERNFA
jgi:patatin-like phospholipase/acyl hydrolase